MVERSTPPDDGEPNTEIDLDIPPVVPKRRRRSVETPRADKRGSDPLKTDSTEPDADGYLSAENHEVRFEITDDGVIRDAREAWERIKQVADRTYDDWMLVAEALAAGRQWATVASNSRGPTGKGYAQYFHHWLEEKGFGDIDKSDRNRLLAIHDSREEIDAWRATRTPEERRQWNAPSTIWRISRCKDRGLPRYRIKTSPAKGNNIERENDISKENARELDVLLVKLANTAVNSARDARMYRGLADEVKRRVGPAIVGAVRDAADEWQRTLNDLEFDSPADEPEDAAAAMAY